MSIPDYDNWKLMTPEEDYEAGGGKICPFCGAYDTAHCENIDDDEDWFCAWEESEPDPDDLMEQRREDREFEARNPRSGDDF